MPIFDLFDTAFGFNDGSSGVVNSNQSRARPTRRRPTRTLFDNERGTVQLKQNQQSEGFLRNVLSQLGVDGADQVEVNRVINTIKSDPASLDDKARGDSGTTQRKEADKAKTVTEEQKLLDRSLADRRASESGSGDASTLFDRLEALLDRLEN